MQNYALLYWRYFTGVLLLMRCFTGAVLAADALLVPYFTTVPLYSTDTQLYFTGAHLTNLSSFTGAIRTGSSYFTVLHAVSTGALRYRCLLYSFTLLVTGAFTLLVLSWCFTGD